MDSRPYEGLTLDSMYEYRMGPTRVLVKSPCRSGWYKRTLQPTAPPKFMSAPISASASVSTSGYKCTNADTLARTHLHTFTSARIYIYIYRLKLMYSSPAPYNIEIHTHAHT